MASSFPPNYNQPIPNNPFYYPDTNYLRGEYGPFIVGGGLFLDYSTATISAGGSGPGGVNTILGSLGINVSPNVGGVVTLTNTGVLTLTAGPGISVSGAGGNLVITNTAPAVVASGTVTQVATGPGLTGGPINTSGTISLAPSGVGPGTYTNPTITVDQYGRITFATPGTPSPSTGLQATLPLQITSTFPQTLSIINASTTSAGAVQLNSSVSSTSTSQAATPSAVKQAYDAASTALTNSANAVTTANAANATATTALTNANTALTAAAAAQTTASLAVPCASFTAKGQVLAATGAGSFVAFNPGANGQVLVACSTSASGLAWANPATGTGTVTLLNTGTGLIGGPINTSGTISLANTAVSPGSYTNANITVDAQGRITAASNGSSGAVTSVAVTSPAVNTGTAIAPIIGVQTATTGQLGAVRIGTNIDVAAGIISVKSSSTAQSGIVQLNNTVTSTSITEALTAAQGKNLQDQIDALAVAGNLTLAGTFDASTSQTLSVSSAGTAAGFTLGSNLPAPALANTDYFVIVTTAGTYNPPGGGGPYNANQGDWFLSNGTTWQYLNVGSDFPIASTGTAGIVELATIAETQTGTDSTRAVTPAGLAASYIPVSQLTSKGSLISATGANTPVALPVGADGEVLTACAAAPSGLCWAPASTPAIPCACITAKGTLVTGTAANTPVALPVGLNGQILVADSACAEGLKWAAGCPGTLTSITAGTALTGGTITTSGTIALADTAVTPGSYTYGSFTVDQQGRLTAAVSGTAPVTAVTGVAPIVSSGGTTPAISLADTAVTPGSYTYATLTVDQQGRLTAAASGNAPNTTVTAPITNSGNAFAPVIGLADSAVTPGTYTYSTFTVDQKGIVTAASSGSAPNTTVVAPITNTGTAVAPVIGLADTAVTPGTYTYSTFTVDQQGRLTAASSGVNPVTVVTGTAPISVTAGTTPDVSIAASSTTNPGAVQLYDNVDSTSTTLALTAAQGKVLQDQITALVNASNLQLAATLNASTGLIDSVTSTGVAAGYVSGSSLPVASITTLDTYAIVTEPGTVTPPGGAATAATRGDWFVVTETSPGVYAWTFLNVGFDAPYATTAVPGIVCLSTDALAQAGVDTTTALTPANAAAAYIPKACVTAKGAIVTGTAASTPVALPVGTNGQVLYADSSSSSGLCWGTRPITCLDFDAKGDLLAGYGSDSFGTLSVGTNGQILYADSACAPGMRWGAGPVTCLEFAAKGDILVGTAAAAYDNLPVGTDGQVLVACSTATTGVCWLSAPITPATPTSLGVMYGCTAFDSVVLGQNAAGTVTGAGNIALGKNSLKNTTTAPYNIALGLDSLCSISGVSGSNVGVGFASLSNLTSGTNNIALGSAAGICQTSGSFNVLIGPSTQALNPTGSCQLAIGYCNCCLWLSGDSTKAIRPGAGIVDCAGSCGTVGQVLTSTGSNAICWVNAPAAAIPCACITAKGDLIAGTAANTPTNLPVGTDGQFLVACSTASTGLCWATTSLSPATPITFGTVKGCTENSNTGLGCEVFGANAIGASCGHVGIGRCALYNVNSSAYNNIAIGSAAGQNITSAAENVLIGFVAGCSLTTPGANTAVGTYSLRSATTGNTNTAIGHSTLQAAIDASANDAHGANALYALTSGIYNVAMGGWSMYNATSASANTAVGHRALNGISTGGCNVGLGLYSGQNITTGVRNVAIGPEVTVPNGAASCQLAIGYSSTACWLVGDANCNLFTYKGLVIKGTNGSGNPGLSTNDTGFYQDNNYGASLQFGNTFGGGKRYIGFTTNGTVVGSIFANGTTQTSYGTSSDYRLKENVADIRNATETLRALPVHEYNFITEPEVTRQGFLAHELQEFVPQAVGGEKDEVDENGDPKYQAVDYSQVVPLLTAALKESISRIDELEAKIARLEANG